MLISLSIANFAITERLELEFFNGMTAITGETGAGKSISLDALGLALGNRSDSSLIKHGADKTDIHAVFDINALPNIQKWLEQNELDGEGECILRRIITKDGRSKAYINGYPVNLQQLKSLGSQLVDIHSQHAHHHLLQRESHQQLLDAYGHTTELSEQTTLIYKQWQDRVKQIRALEEDNQNTDTRREYIQFQLSEFESLDIKENEYNQLLQKHNKLANAEDIQHACQEGLSLCRDNEQNALNALNNSQSALAKLSNHDDLIKDTVEMLVSASIQIEEACNNLQMRLEENQSPKDLAALEQRMSQFYDLARKHRTEPHLLIECQDKLIHELDSLENSGAMIEQLEKESGSFKKKFETQAKKLSKQRTEAAKNLANDIQAQLQLLGMKHCVFEAALNSDNNKPTANGFDSIEFLVSTNPGQKPQALQKIASGGELSRISLAIQVITAKTSTIPTLIFDEVDVGIGGATAEVVGDLLKNLCKSAQIICVTHQPQVAAKSSQHYLVSKQQQNDSTQTDVVQLDKKGRIAELARMLGGVEITQRTLDHAAEMLQSI